MRKFVYRSETCFIIERIMIMEKVSLANAYPAIANEWHPTKNGDITPDQVSRRSGKRVWWLGKCGHEWEATIHNRSRGYGCPICAERKVLPGFNDLSTIYPEIAKEWHPVLNKDLSPTNVTKGSSKKVWWKCNHGHEWQATVDARTSGSGCPVCSKLQYSLNSKTPKPGNSLFDKYPGIAEEWHPTKNGSLTPDKVYPASNIKVWWLCKNGHAYLAQPNDRIRNHGCPICNKSTSFAEQALFYYIRKSWPDTCSRDVSAIGMELDIFIPSLRIAVEYDGVAWHVNKSISEKKKNALCKTQGILLIRVREKGLDIYDDCCCVVRNDIRTSKSLDAAIEAVLNNISEGVKSDINTQRDRFKILELYAFEKEKNSLAVKYPQIAREWHPNKNGMLTPEKVSFSSKVVAWWLGECGHEWEMAVDLRTGKKPQGCPICAGKRVLQGFNDLKTIYPEIAQEWNLEKNKKLSLGDITCKSSISVWWLGTCGHEWKARVADRVEKKLGCPYCSGHRAMSGFNDLVTIKPEIAAQWHPTKNGSLTPDQVTVGSKKRVWWYLPYDDPITRNHFDFEWNTTVDARTSHDSGCPFISGRAVWPGFNDLATIRPDLASEWHPTKNGSFMPSQVTANSNKKVWWYVPYDDSITGKHFDFEWE